MLPRRTVDRSNAAHRERGQSLSEFALVLPFLLVIGLAAVDYGRAYHDYASLTNAVRTGAAYASSSPEAAADLDGVRHAVLEELGGGWDEDDVTISLAVGTDADGEPYAEVTATYTFDTLVEWPALPSSFDIERSAQMRVIQ